MVSVVLLEFVSVRLFILWSWWIVDVSWFWLVDFGDVGGVVGVSGVVGVKTLVVSVEVGFL